MSEAVKFEFLQTLECLGSRDLYQCAVQLSLRATASDSQWRERRRGLTERFLELIQAAHHESASPQAKNPASCYRVVPLLPKACMRFAGSCGNGRSLSNTFSPIAQHLP